MGATPAPLVGFDKDGRGRPARAPRVTTCAMCGAPLLSRRCAHCGHDTRPPPTPVPSLGTCRYCNRAVYAGRPHATCLDAERDNAARLWLLVFVLGAFAVAYLVSIP